MSVFKKFSLKKISMKLSALLIGSGMAGYASTASAQQIITARGVGGNNTLNDISRSLTNQLGSVPELISTGAYVGGAVFSASGIIALKQHVDNSSQKPMREGLVRLVAGGALFALPAVSQGLTETVGLSNSGGPNPQDFNTPNTGATVPRRAS